MEETINLEEIFETLRKHLVTIIISMFAGLAGSLSIRTDELCKIKSESE